MVAGLKVGVVGVYAAPDLISTLFNLRSPILALNLGFCPVEIIADVL